MTNKEAGGRATIVLQHLRGDCFYCFPSENKLLPKLFFTVISEPAEPIKEDRLRKRSADALLHFVDLL